MIYFQSLIWPSGTVFWVLISDMLICYMDPRSSFSSDIVHPWSISKWFSCYKNASILTLVDSNCHLVLMLVNVCVCVVAIVILIYAVNECFIFCRVSHLSNSRYWYPKYLCILRYFFYIAYILYFFSTQACFSQTV